MNPTPQSVIDTKKLEAIQNDPKIHKAWAFYDWANSSYPLVINTAIFPIYFKNVTANVSEVSIFGVNIAPQSAFAFASSLSFLILVFLAPILSSIADFSGSKKSFLKFFCLLGSLSCAGLFFLTDVNHLELGLICNLLASIGFYGSLVFYNAYLPEIATPDKQDALSARGFSMGYVGSLIILTMCLALIMLAPEQYRIILTRTCFIFTALWWFGFAQWCFKYLPDQEPTSKTNQRFQWSQLQTHLLHLWKCGNILYQRPLIRMFLFAFFLYSIAMQTIFMMAVFLGEYIALPDSKMLMTIMLLQVEAILGALIFSKASSKLGNSKVLILAVTSWLIATMLCASLKKADPQVFIKFYIAAALVGLSMGGLQSLSRSTYSKIIPAGNNATYFSVYDVIEKMSIMVGTFTFGLTMNITHSLPISAFVLGLFFLMALVVLLLLLRYEGRHHIRIGE